jgi:hypothetical protein
MRAFLLIPIAIALLPVAALAQTLPENPDPAQPASSQWNRVRDLANGDEIEVRAFRAGTVHCRFAGATDDFLFCDRSYGWFTGQDYRMERSELLDVRISHETRNRRLLIGAAAVAGGVFFGVSQQNPSDTGTRVFAGLAGAGISALLATPVAWGVAHFLIPGESIYRAGSQSGAAAPAQPAAQGPLTLPDE